MRGAGIISAGEEWLKDFSIPSVSRAVSSIQLVINSAASIQVLQPFARKPLLYSLLFKAGQGVERLSGHETKC